MVTDAGRGQAVRKRRIESGEAWAFPVRVWAIHWLIVQLAATYAIRFGMPNAPSPPYGEMPPPMAGLAHWIVEPLRNWDGLWYRLIALDGYAGGLQSARAAFWPLFPWLMRGGGDLTGWNVETVGYLIANLAFLGALLVIYRLVTLDYGDPAEARRTLWALSLFPTAFFFSAVYTESLFLLLSAGALYLWRRDLIWFAGLAGIGAALTRSAGVFLILPFLALLWDRYRTDWRGYFPGIVPAFFPALGPAIFAAVLQRDQGNWNAFIDVQEQWNRYSAPPWETLRCAVSTCFRLGGEPDGISFAWWHDLLRNPGWDTITSQSWRTDFANSDVLELVVTVFFIGLAIIGLKLLPAYQTVWILPGLIIPLLQPSQVHALMSMPRFVLVLFPLFIVLGWVIRPRVIAIPWYVISVSLLVLFTAQFALWYWVS
ncbi:MAG: mannosyltransferase family protein [Thermomicrobiales bacterium]